MQVTITGNYPDPAFMIQHCGESMPRLATIDGHGDLINSTYPPSLVPTVNIVRSLPLRAWPHMQIKPRSQPHAEAEPLC